jgi:hypothetical protein
MKLVSTISPGLAEEYGLRTYSKGDCVLFQNEYYRCIADETEPVFPMDETKWEKVDFSVEVTGLKTGLTAEATVREEGDKANATAIKANSDAISALTTAVADEVKTRTEEDAKRPTKDEAILVGENKNKDFSLDGDYSASQGYLTDTAVNASVANIKYFFIPPEPLTSCGIVQVKVYGGLEADITYKDPVLFVLWSYSGSGAFSDDTCKYLGFSDNTVTLAELTAATCTFTSNPYGLQITAGQGLIVQGVPADVTPDNTWKWSEKADLYTVLALACHSEPDSSVFEDWIVATDEGEANKVRFGGMLGVFLKNSVVFSAKNGGIDVANGTGMTVEDVDKTYKTNAKGIGTIILDSAKSYADTQDTTVLSEAKTYTDTANAKAVQKGDNYADDTAAVPSFTLNSEKQGVEGSGTHVSVSPTTYFSGSVREDSTKPTLSTVDTVYKVEAVESTGVSNESGIGTIILNEAKAYADTVSQKVLRYMGSVATIAELPADAKQGDMYNVTETGANYAWTGEEWDKLSETVDLSGLVTKTTEVNGKKLENNITLTGKDITVSTEETTTLEAKAAELDTHIANTDNPHAVTAEQTGAIAYPTEHDLTLVSPTTGSSREENKTCMVMWGNSIVGEIQPGDVIKSLTLEAVTGMAVETGSFRAVLWSNDKGDHSSEHNKLLGWASDLQPFQKGEGLSTTWHFDNAVVPTGFKRLIVQMERSDVSIDSIKNFVWGSQNCYTVMTVAYNNMSSGDDSDGNQHINASRQATSWGRVTRGSLVYSGGTINLSAYNLTTKSVSGDTLAYKTGGTGDYVDVETAIAGKQDAGNYAKTDEANTYEGEQIFQHTTYAPTGADIAYGVGAAYKASRGVVSQEIIGQLVMPSTTTPTSSVTGISSTKDELPVSYISTVDATKPITTSVGKFTKNGWEGKAALTDTPTAPTAAAGTNTTQIATTAFVTSAVSTAVSSDNLPKASSTSYGVVKLTESNSYVTLEF